MLKAHFKTRKGFFLCLYQHTRRSKDKGCFIAMKISINCRNFAIHVTISVYLIRLDTP